MAPAKWSKSESVPLSPSHTVQLSPAALKQFQALAVPSTSAEPSLDGSLTSEELAASSCPPTPDMRKHDDNLWENDASVQLDPSAFSLLQHINGEGENQQHTVIEVPEAALQEMREVVESPSRFGGLQIQTDSLSPAENANDELSALSIPSPSHFFSSLDSAVARRAWAGNKEPNTSTAAEFYGVPFVTKDEPPLPTSTATSFYNVPWQTRPEGAVEHVITLSSPKAAKDPVTARRMTFTPSESVVEEVHEIDETYQEALAQNASANFDRTKLWLSSQDAYLRNILTDEDMLLDTFKDVDGVTPKSPESARSPDSKKSVRFAEVAPEQETSPVAAPSPSKNAKRISPIHDGTFWEAWCHTKRSARARDVFQHRQMRAEAEQVRRNSAGKTHADQLKGHFELKCSTQTTKSRPVSGFVNNDHEDEEKKQQIATAERQRSALEQVQSSAWHVEAQKELNGGTLLTSPIVATFRQRNDVNILDLAGQAHCSWAWDVAVTHPRASVYTTVPTDLEAHIAQSSLEGPDNHQVVAAAKLWDLPFEDDHFDVISARNLYMHLRNQTGCDAADEWDLTLQECLRVLKPGGYLEFDLLDAEMTHAEGMAQAMGVEFAYNLKTRGYDPCSGKNFLPRLKRAGFGNIKRAWMVLPVADSAPRWTDTGKKGPVVISTPSTGASSGFPHASPATPECYGPPLTGSTKEVRAITGLVGARAWEQWMLKVNAELGRSEERCLEGVGKALEESGKADAGWKCLVGWAQKAA